MGALNICSKPSLEFGSRDAFEHHYNRTSFLFHHSLHESGLFEWSSLIELAKRHPQVPSHTYRSAGKVRVGDSWGAGEKAGYSLSDTVAGIHSNDSLVLFKHLEEDPVFAPFLRDVGRRILDLAGAQMRDDVTIGRGTLLVASPWRITSYHIDADVNFLFQIAGDKQFRVFDQTDREMLSHRELEDFFLGNANGAVYDLEKERGVTRYDLRPGDAIHIPVITGHWAQNQASPSIALSVNFDIRSMTALKRIYRINGRLRKLGLKPVPPGVSTWRDNLKSNVIQMLKG